MQVWNYTVFSNQFLNIIDGSPLINLPLPYFQRFCLCLAPNNFTFQFNLKIRFPHVPKTPGFVLLQGIIRRLAGQVAILIVIYNPKLGQAKTTYLICIPIATKELLVRDCKGGSRTSKRNSIASVHMKTEQASGMSGKSSQIYHTVICQWRKLN